MSITSGFFNSIDGDRLYNARDMSMYFKGLISDGVFENVDDKFQVTAGGGMSVNVASGRAVIDCQWVNNDAPVNLTINPAPVGKVRNDVVALRLDLNENARNISLVVLEGEAGTGGSLALPYPSNTDKVKELFLCQIEVNSNATSISASKIKDLRGTWKCPYVTGLIKQVDTAQLFEQYQASCEEYYNTMTAQFDAYIAAKQAAFDSWFSTLTETLHVDASIMKYQNSVTTTKETTEITIGIPEYETGDVLLAHIGGVLFVEGSEFSVVGTGASAKIVLKKSIIGTNVVTFIVIKSVVGGDVLSAEIDKINGEVI